MKTKVMTIVGTRPEIIKLSRIICELDKLTNHTLVHSGQNYDYELNEIFFKDLEIRKPDHFLNAVGKTTAETISKIINESDKIIDKLKPDALLLYGDTNSCLSVISAKKKQVPIFHLEAGNRCFDQRVPEEINRKIVDHVSDINLTYSDISRNYLINEGFPPDRIIKIGSPMYEVIHDNLNKINSSNILKKLSLKKNQFFLVSCHREENVDSKSNFSNLISSLNIIAEKFNLPIIFSTHPRTKKILNKMNFKVNSLINFIDPLNFSDYNNLQINSLITLSDSGTISEESSILNFKALNIRETHERLESMEETSVIMCGLKSERIIQAIEILSKQETDKSRNIKIVDEYSYDNVSLKVERIILSYIDYVNRVVWSKES